MLLAFIRAYSGRLSSANLAPENCYLEVHLYIDGYGSCSFAIPSLIINYIQYYNIILQLEDLFTYSQGIKSYRFWCFQSISCGGASGGVASIFVLSCRIGYKNDSKLYLFFLVVIPCGTCCHELLRDDFSP